MEASEQQRAANGPPLRHVDATTVSEQPASERSTPDQPFTIDTALPSTSVATKPVVAATTRPLPELLPSAIEPRLNSALRRNRSSDPCLSPQSPAAVHFSSSVHGHDGYFGAPATPYATIRKGHSSRLSIGSTPSKDSSPLSSAHSSTSSFPAVTSSARNSPAPPIPAAFLKEKPGNRDLSSSSTVGTTHVSAPTSTPAQHYTTSQEIANAHVEHPGYPNQAFAALQSQIHPTNYPPLRTYSSHPSQHASYSNSAIPTQKSADFAKLSEHSAARTAGNTPASSPGLFTTSQSAAADQRALDDSSVLSSPFLHWTQMREPKETHRVDIDVDPISGRKIINQYEIVDELGRGEHGKVKLGRNLETGESVAIKIVERYSKRRRLGKLGNPEDKVKKEVAILKKARHENVVSLLEVIDDPGIKKVYIVLEFVARGEIPWREVGAAEIVYIEQKRIDRETRGIQEDEPTIIETQRILREAARRRARSRRQSQQQKRQAASKSSFWSLEYGEDDEGSSGPERHTSENDSDLATLHRLESSTSLYQSVAHTHNRQSSLSQTPAPLPYDIDLPPLDSDNEEGDPASSQPSHTSSAVGLPESVFNPRWSELLTHPPDGSAAQSLGDLPRLLGTSEEEIFVPVLTLDQARGVFRDTVLGLEYLHYQGIIHRDIKPANLLWTKDHRVKISDFGVSYLGRPVRDEEVTDEAVDVSEDSPEAKAFALDEAIELAKTVGTPAFYAPELCRTDFLENEDVAPPVVTGQIDIWALGVTLFCIIFARLPFIASDQFAMFKAIVHDDLIIPRRRLKAVNHESSSRPGSRSGKSTPVRSPYRASTELLYEDVDDDLVDLLRRLLIKDPASRITIQEIKRHPWILRGINNPNVWVEENDPDRQNEGRKIHVTHEDIEKAVVPLGIIERMRSGFRKVGHAIGFGGKPKEGRRRRGSAVRSAESPPSQTPSASSSSKDLKQGQMVSLHDNDAVVTALKASRESEHPLAHSVTASPDVEERERYFGPGPYDYAPSSSSFDQHISSVEESGETTPAVGRPNGPERALSNSGASVKTIRAIQPGQPLSPATSPGLPSRPTALDPLGSSNLTGIFGGARRGLRRMESRESDASGPLYRSPSIDRVSIGDEDPHGLPSLGLSGTVAAGHLDRPTALKEPPKMRDDTQSGKSTLKALSRESATRHLSLVTASPTTATPQDSRRPGDSSIEAFQRAQVELTRRRGLEFEEMQRRPVSVQFGPTSDCPPSPDDEDFYERQDASLGRRPEVQAPGAHPMVSSSSDDHFTSSTSHTSQSTSHPSIPSIVSASSSLEAEEFPGYYKSNRHQPSSLLTDDTVTPESVTGASSAEALASQSSPIPARTHLVPEEDPGYSGDHAADSEDEEDSEDDFLMMSKSKPDVPKKT